MKIRKLRGHHLICVHGFQGMGYSPAFIEKMGEIVQEIRDPDCDIKIEVKVGFDETCEVCPNRGETACEASENSEAHVRGMDRKVLTHLQLEENAAYSKGWLIQRTANMVEPADLDLLCKDCSWLELGICKVGLAELKRQMARKSI
jgi:uncharacterized protein